MKKILSRARYLWFRLFYISSHWLIFHLLPEPKTNKPLSVHSHGTLLLCGIEPNSRYAIEKLEFFCQLCQEYFPHIKPVLLTKLKQPPSEAILHLEYVHWEYQERARLLGKLGQLLFRRGDFCERTIATAAKESLAMIDLGEMQACSHQASGYTANMLANIVFAKKFGLPHYIFPQSFGPFDYAKPLVFVLRPMLKRVLTYSISLNYRDPLSAKALNKLNPNLKISFCHDLLLFRKPKNGTASALKTQVVWTPDRSILSSNLQFNKALDTVRHIADQYKITQITLQIYDSLDIQKYKKLKDKPSNIEVRILDENSHVKLDDSCNNLNITNKYHAALHHLHHGNPALLYLAPPQLKELYQYLKIERLIYRSHGESFDIASIKQSWDKITEQLSHTLCQANIDIPMPFFPKK